jgi:hypothetical protein
LPLATDRCVPCPLICLLCEQHNDDDWHVFFNCHDSIQALHFVFARAQNFHTAADLIFSICAKVDRDTAGRNIGFKASQDWQQWFSVQQQSCSHVQQQQHITVWQKPPLGSYKCNVDAEFHKGLN